MWNITNLASTAALTAVENKFLMFVISSNKTDYNTKIKKIEKKITDHDHI